MKKLCQNRWGQSIN